MPAQDHLPLVAIVEDDATQRRIIDEFLRRNGYAILGFEGAAAFRRAFERSPADLVLLDVGLPGEDGFALARWLREKSTRVGIIMVTASGDTIDRVVGLETGADDYVVKPFEPRELLARVKSVLRRVRGDGAPPRARRIRVGKCLVDLDKRALIGADDAEEPLSAGEFDLLKLLVEHPNRALARDWILESVAHREAGVFDRAIDQRITRLRKRIEIDPRHPTAIRTVRHVGYMFVPPKD